MVAIVLAMDGTQRADNGNRPDLVVQIEPLALRLPAAGEVLGGINRQTVARLIAEGELEPIWIGETRMVDPQSIKAYVERQRAKARAARQGEAASAAA